METYNHFEYGEKLARRLKPVCHTDHRPRFFTAFGLEDLYNFEDRMSRVDGMVLIAVEGQEMDSNWNRGDCLQDVWTYSFIFAENTRRDRPDTIDRAVHHCREVAMQVRAHLLNDPQLTNTLDREMTMNGIGPIGDGFYGVVLTFRLEEYPDWEINPELWNEE